MSDDLRAKIGDLIADWRETARRVRPLESAPLTAEKRNRIKEWMFYTNRADELEAALSSASPQFERVREELAAMRDAEHELSDRYVALRVKLEPFGAMDTQAGGGDRFEKTEAALDSVLAELAALRQGSSPERAENKP